MSTFTLENHPSRDLGELVTALTEELSNGKKNLNNLYNIMMSYNYELNEWKRFEFWDDSKKYTRNLIAAEPGLFALMLLCWNSNKGSPIHNHNGSECFLRVISGEVEESKYHVDEHEAHEQSDNNQQAASPVSDLQLTSQLTYPAGACTFINDSLGVHKVETKGSRAITLHCYIPGYHQCKSFTAEGHVKQCSIAFDTEQGEVVCPHQC